MPVGNQPLPRPGAFTGAAPSDSGAETPDHAQGSPTVTDLTELHEILTRERLLLERLLYRVVCLRNLIVGGHSRFIGWASDDVEAAASAVAAAELRRAAVYAEVAAAAGLPDEFDFDALLASSTEPTTTLLSQVRAELAQLTGELRSHLRVAGEQAADGLASATEVHARLAGMDLTAAVAPAGPGHVDARL